LSLPNFVGLKFRLSAAVSVVTEFVLASLGEETIDGHSMLQMRLDGGAGSLDLAFAFMCLASSMTSAREMGGRRRCYL
jgi:hypothetical protein